MKRPWYAYEMPTGGEAIPCTTLDGQAVGAHLLTRTLGSGAPARARFLGLVTRDDDPEIEAPATAVPDRGAGSIQVSDEGARPREPEEPEDVDDTMQGLGEPDALRLVDPQGRAPASGD